MVVFPFGELTPDPELLPEEVEVDWVPDPPEAFPPAPRLPDDWLFKGVWRSISSAAFRNKEFQSSLLFRR